MYECLKYTKWMLFFFLAGMIFLAGKTIRDMEPVTVPLNGLIENVERIRVVDRYGVPLSLSYQNRWNSYDTLPLYDIPSFLKTSFVVSEDKRFYSHHGIDYLARLHAIWQNITCLSVVRGASSITEQAVRLIHVRPRTIWSRWLEGFEATKLERKISKNEILEFYLNQVPYASNRRGVLQASRFYFNRDIDTLTKREMLALVVLVRAPSRFDLYKDPQKIEPAINRLSKKLLSIGILTPEEYAVIQSERFHLKRPKDPVFAGHFIHYLFRRGGSLPSQKEPLLRTTLDSNLQKTTQDILDHRLKDLKSKNVSNGAVLIVDHLLNEVLAWVNGGKGEPGIPGSMIDAVTTVRQPGSSLKPFLYASAIEQGWTPAHILLDEPLAEQVGQGIHAYNNYSRTFYGPVSLRDALGNSLNIPAVRTIRFVGVKTYLDILHDLGIQSLYQPPYFYGDGLALGNGEVTLLELVTAYTALSSRGIFSPVKLVEEDTFHENRKRIFSPETASLISNMLSDPGARRFEFGENSILNYAVQTAVKTGTSSDYRDAWAIGYNHRYTVGIWMGNLNGTPMDGVTGSLGPAMVLRSIFSELNRFTDTKTLYLSPDLVQKRICDPTILNSEGVCVERTEWFIAGTERDIFSLKEEEGRNGICLVQPGDGIRMAMDPRIPDDREAFEFRVEGIAETDAVDWVVNGKVVKTTRGGTYLWPLQPGAHRVAAIVKRDALRCFTTDTSRIYIE